jgi:hypothetical protein
MEFKTLNPRDPASRELTIPPAVHTVRWQVEVRERFDRNSSIYRR